MDFQAGEACAVVDMLFLPFRCCWAALSIIVDCWLVQVGR